MKWTFVINQKLKVALLLGVVMCLVVLFNLILQKNISDINRSINSIYNDRLIPATDIFHLSENLHNRQLAVENLLFRTGTDSREVKRSIGQYNQKMQSLISKYEKTFLVDEELIFLEKFKKNIAAYSTLENQILTLSATNKVEALSLYENEGRIALKNTLSQLSDLTTIQSTVGTKLINDTKGIVATSNFLSDLQLVLAIVIGLMITVLVVSSKIINQPQAKFKWN